MKIATNVHRDAFGGITISNLALFDWLEDKEDTIVGIEIITGRHILGPAIFRHYLPSFFRHHIINAIDILPLHSWEKIGNPRKKWNTLIEVSKNILRKEEPDILLINGTYNTPWILARAAKELGIPIILRYAGVLQKEVNHKNFFIRRRLLAYEKWLALSATAIIFPSDICRKTVEKDILGCPVKNGIIIPNPAKGKKAFSRVRNGRYTLAAIGRWTPIKNFQAFVATHQELLHEEWPHKAIVVTSRWDAKSSLPETIERKEPMSHEDLLKFYRSVDIVVVASHFETFCNVAAEAVVNGTSVLVSKNVGFAEILIKAGLKRMVIDSFNNPKKIVVAIKRIARKKLSKKEIERVSALLDPQVIHVRILNVLNKVLKRKAYAC